MFTCLFDVVGYALLESMCLCAFCHVSCLDLHLYILICLDSCSSMSMCSVFTCLHAFFYAYMPLSMSPHACMLGFSFLHAFMRAFTCLDVHLHAYMHISMPIYFHAYFHAYISLHASCYLPWACVLYAMSMCLGLGYVCHAMCYCSPFVALSFFLVILA